MQSILYLFPALLIIAIPILLIAGTVKLVGAKRGEEAFNDGKKMLMYAAVLIVIVGGAAFLLYDKV